MNLDLLWFLPAIIVYIYLWYESYRSIKYYGWSAPSFGYFWVALNLGIIPIICTFIGINKLIS